MAYPKIQRKYRTYEKVSIPDRTIKTGGAKRPTITLGRVAPTPTPGPTLSVVSNDQPARGSTIVMVGGDPNKTYTYVPQSDYQTISYSDTMKKQAQQYSTSKSTGERVAGNIYLGADKAASAYEDFVSPVTKTFDTSVVVDTGNPVKDFLANAGRGFVTLVVKAPSDIVRLSGASGLSVAMLGNANNKQKAEVLSTGLPNFVDAQVDSFKSNPGAFIGGVAAGVVGGKVIGKVASKGGSGTKKTTTAKTEQKTVTSKTTSQYKYKGNNKTVSSGKPKRRVEQSYKRANSNAATLETFMRQRRVKDIAGDIELGARGRDFAKQVRQSGKVTTVKTVRDLNTGRKARVVDAAEPKRQTALVTAKDARTPRNNSRKERARVARVVEVQKASGAIFQDMKLRRDSIPQRLSTEKGLITATDARKPRNRTNKERQRVKRVIEAQRKSGAAKPSASTLLDLQKPGRRRRPQTGKTTGKQTAPRTRKPRAYETKIQRREYVEGQPETFRISEVPRYAAGARRPASLNVGGRKVLALDGVLTEPTYTLKLEPVRQQRLSRMPKADKKPTEKGKGAGAKEKAKAESPRKKRAMVEFEKVDTNRFVKSKSSKKSGSTTTRRRPTSEQVKNSGAGKTKDGKTIFTNSKGEQFVEVDNGNGTKARVRLKPSETAQQKPSKATSSKKKGKTITEKPAPKRNIRKTTGKSAGTKQSAEQQSQTVKKREVVRVVSGGQTNISGAAQTLSVLKKQNNNTVVDGGGTTTGQTEGTVTGSTTTNKPASTSQQTTSSRVKSAEKRETQTTGTPRARAKPKAVPAVRPKKKKPVAKTTEEDKKKQRKKIRKMKEDAFRFETVNTFGWIKDSKPAAKPRKIK